MALERSDWLCAEVDKLVKANILRKVRYQTWVTNPVLVKKADGNWQMCVDFKDVNKAFPKDNYPLPEVDWKEAESAFQEMKKVLAELPTLIAPISGETLTLYLAASKEAVSSVLIADRGKVLYKPEISGQMAKWAVELGEHKITFSSRNAVKGQILTDYLAELPADVEVSAEHQDMPAPILTPWELYTDGACNAVGVGAGVILTGPSDEEHTYALRFNFVVTNNKAEYEALLAGMRIAHKLNVKILHAYVDSKLVCSQVNGDFEARDIAMQQYLSLVRNLADQFEAFQISHVMRGQNKKADALSKLAALVFDHLGKRVLIEELHVKSIVMMPLVAPVEESSSTWMTPIIAFLRDGTLLEDSVDAKKIRTKAPMYALEGDVLYRRNYLVPHLRCIGPNEAKEANGQCEVTNRDIVTGIKARLGHSRIGWVD
ncbi:uncharacterized protein [Rutidosis leptorrhynchoides]|uniref:uncharacterized protein n=1 Tax=Rutidosis leptorrhynchoides TaxID=125765 RepID=UPI003A992DB9